MCRRWFDSYVAFLQDMGRRPSADHSIERRDNSKGYEPGNCYWATRYEQNRNTCQNHYVTFGGRTLCITDWLRELKLSKGTYDGRVRRGWPVLRALGLEKVR